MPSFAPVLFSKRVLPVPHPKGLLSFLQGEYGVYSTAPALAILWENRYYGRSLLFQDKFSGAVPPSPLFTLSHLTVTVHPPQEYVPSYSEFETLRSSSPLGLRRRFESA